MFSSLSLMPYNSFVLLILIPTAINMPLVGNQSTKIDTKLGRMSSLQIQCKHENVIFYNGECLTCLEALSTTSSHNCKETLVSNLSSMDYYDCHEREERYILCPATQLAINLLKISKGIKFFDSNIIKVVTVQRAPFSTISGKTYSGVMFDIVEALQKKYNFSFVVSVPPDGNFGALERNKCWNGMVGQILRREADIGAASFSVTLERSRVIDFTMAIHQEPTAILIPAPTPGNKFAILVRPFEKEVWISLFTTIFVIVPAFYVMHKYSIQFSNGRFKNIKIKPFRTTAAEILLFITGSIVQESVKSPGNQTSRFLLATWWMITLILANTYTGFLVSFLSAPKLYNSVNNLEELVHQSSLKWTFRKGTAHHNLFKSEESHGIFKSVGDGVQESDLVTSDLDGVAKTLKANTAFIKEKSFLEFALGEDFESVKHCRLTLAKQEFFTVGIAFILQKGSPILPLLNFEISNVISTGLMEKWKRKNWPDNLHCVDAASYILSTQPSSRKLNVGDFQGVSLLWGCGITVASIGFFAEHIYSFLSKFPRNSRLSKMHDVVNKFAESIVIIIMPK